MRWVLIFFTISSVISCKQIDTTKHIDDSVVVQRVVSVYDADTFRASLKDWPDYLGDDIGIRVRGVDAPEIRGMCNSEKIKAKKARDYVRQKLETADNIVLKDIEPGKYFRLIADVDVNGDSLAQELIKKGYARPYFGGKRSGWCK